MAQTSVLPEPTRVEGQEFGNLMMGPNQPDDRNAYITLGDSTMSSSGAPLHYSDDELAVLAENFFQQRPEIEGSVNWWNMGDLGAS
jgi:hypothetical protein